MGCGSSTPPAELIPLQAEPVTIIDKGKVYDYEHIAKELGVLKRGWVKLKVVNGEYEHYDVENGDEGELLAETTGGFLKTPEPGDLYHRSDAYAIRLSRNQAIICINQTGVSGVISTKPAAPQGPKLAQGTAFPCMTHILKEVQERMDGEESWGTFDVSNMVAKGACPIINKRAEGDGSMSPFDSIEEVLMFVEVCSQFVDIWNENVTAGTMCFPEGASQVHAVAEIFSFYDEEKFPEALKHPKVKDFCRLIWPIWIKAQLSISDPEARMVMTKGGVWGLKDDTAYKTALMSILDAEELKTGKVPSFWDKSSMDIVIMRSNEGVNFADDENTFLLYDGSRVKIPQIGHNFFNSIPSDKQEFEQFQKLFDRTLHKVYTRDRKGGSVPDRLELTRGVRIQNLKNWTEYSTRRSEVMAEMKQHRGKGGPKMMDALEGLKTQGVFPDENKYKLNRDANEQWLFHGTNDFAADCITRGDFLVNLAGSNAGTLYGNGVYLAESCSKSDEYTKENAKGERCLLVCRATLGFVNYIDEEVKDPGQCALSCTKGPYHSVLGDREKLRGTFKEILVYDNSQAYPEYVFWYKRIYGEVPASTE